MRKAARRGPSPTAKSNGGSRIRTSSPGGDSKAAPPAGAGSAAVAALAGGHRFVFSTGARTHGPASRFRRSEAALEGDERDDVAVGRAGGGSNKGGGGSGLGGGKT